MGEFRGNKDVLIADVDCTSSGQTLCSDVGVRGYPTVKYGDPNNLEDYKGGRDFEALKKFADENLKATCGPTNIDLCDEKNKAFLNEFMAMPHSALIKQIAEKEATIEKLEGDFKEVLDGLQSQYTEANEKKDKDVADFKNQGLGLMKAVMIAKKSDKEEL